MYFAFNVKEVSAYNEMNGSESARSTARSSSASLAEEAIVEQTSFDTTQAVAHSGALSLHGGIITR